MQPPADRSNLRRSAHDGSTMVVYTVDGMTCAACQARVEQALQQLAPDAMVTLAPPRAHVPASVPLEAANAAVAEKGNYRLHEARSVSPGSGTEAAFAARARPAAGGAETPRGNEPAAATARPAKTLATYYPLLLITAYLVVASFAGTPSTAGGAHASLQESSRHHWMMNFMAGFFLVFSFFKFLDLRGFADAYRGYDVVAARWPVWGFVYPFVELGLGLCYLFRVAPVATNWVTVVVMTVSIVGVARALLRKQTIRCACLGTVLNLPMSTVTLVEDGLMIAMAAAMLAMS